MTYNEFINNILNTRGRFNCGQEYHERHHIQPKCLGGTNDENNLIDLYANEHFIAHKLLAEENPDNLSLLTAFMLMSQQIDHQLTTEQAAQEYEELRQKFSQALKEKYQNKENHPSYGTHISEERKRKIGQINKGNNYCVGRVISQETRDKIGAANKKAWARPGVKEKVSQKRKGTRLRGENSNAKPVIRLKDKKIYSCMKDAAEDNNIDYSKFKYYIRKHNDEFMIYKDYLEQNNLDK